MSIVTVETTPIEGQKPGTSGLRKKTKRLHGAAFRREFRPGDPECDRRRRGKNLRPGGRRSLLLSPQVAQVILRMCAAQGAKKVIVGQNALLSTPAASHLIRLNKTDGGFIMSASHNPGGLDEDFGLKFNTPNGGPAPEA